MQRSVSHNRSRKTPGRVFLKKIATDVQQKSRIFCMTTRILLLSTLLLAACSNVNSSSNHAPDGGLPATYRSTDGTISVRHPDGWGAKENYHLVTDAYEADGTALLAPTDRTKTTLYEGIFHIAKMSACPVLDGMRDTTIKDRTYHHATWNGVGAGNRYEGETYATETSNGCAVVTFYAHSCNLSPEDCGPTKPKPYDRNALFSIMRQMLETMRIQ